MSVAIVIPARMASTRFPGKPLCDLLGKPMIQWVVEAAQKAGVADRILVATPDQEILARCAAFGAETYLTRNDHPSGTDRLAEVADKVEAEVYINVQGDEPLIDPKTIRACAEPLLQDSSVRMSSVYSICDESELDNPAAVKVVTNIEGFALYFSRHPIPYPRNPRPEPVKKHVGIYAFRRDVLLRFATWSQTPLERAESLEQLRFLENGVRIKMARGEGSVLAVDTPEQAEQVRLLLAVRTS
ncbi:MAG TPA: 3-deoxy-manno-octulosonate cytidylyltransferase [Fimbriimonas sp.]|nr:3-deoxy-manno-octulosonate cytidylyltransferase [Fimbriimonas sp.]